MENKDSYTVSFYLKDEFGQETKFEKTLLIEEEQECDIYGLIDRFKEFLRASGFGETTVNGVTFIDPNENN